MMGQQTRNESLFYYFRLEEQIPKDHLLRLIDHYIDSSFVRERLKRFYSGTAFESIRKSCCASCWWTICMGSPANGVWWKK